MTPERWQQIKSILEEAAQIPHAARPRWLEAACDGDREMLEEVGSFLDHESELDGFIEEPALSFLSERAPDLNQLKPGHSIGPYRLVRLLGQGGMGAVYLAQRRLEFEQRVALKVIHPGLGSREMLRRFHDERQILARLEHPNIARLLDGGTTEQGEPYFAMELVEGEPIDAYCDHHELPTRRRLELFEGVCSALQAAHQSLIIHRDLKPGNILVDGSGCPKLLDFGIAKQLRDDGHDQAATRVGEQVMTLRYASPEQLTGDPVGTTSDVYSLGVVLYEVLTGRLPGGLESLDRAGLFMAVCHQDPPAPSTVITRAERLVRPSGEVKEYKPDAVSQLRDGNPQPLRRRLAGDVDCIVMKALRKEPRQRYASAEHLAADIRRHLNGRPVLARQGNLSYKASKFIRRHRVALSLLSLIVALIVGFAATLLRQLDEKEQARRRSEEVSAFLVDLFQAAAPNQPAGEEPTLRDVLERGRLQLERDLEREPEVLATLRLKLGEVYTSLGDHDGAVELLTGAVELLRLRRGGPDPELAAAYNNLAAVHYSAGELHEAESYAKQSIALRRRLGLDGDLLKPMGTLAAILMERGAFHEAQEIYRESLERRRVALGDRHPNVAVSQRSLATALLATGDLVTAEPLLRQSLDIRRQLYGPKSASVAKVLISLGRLEHARGRLPEAEGLYTEALTIRRQTLGEHHLHTALAKKELAGLLLELGEAETAGVLLGQALETLYQERPSGDLKVAETEALLGAYFAATGRPGLGEVCLRDGLLAHESQLGPDAMKTRRLRQLLEDPVPVPQREPQPLRPAHEEL